MFSVVIRGIDLAFLSDTFMYLDYTILMDKTDIIKKAAD